MQQGCLPRIAGVDVDRQEIYFVKRPSHAHSLAKSVCELLSPVERERSTVFPQNAETTARSYFSTSDCCHLGTFQIFESILIPQFRLKKCRSLAVSRTRRTTVPVCCPERSTPLKKLLLGTRLVRMFFARGAGIEKSRPSTPRTRKSPERLGER